MSTPPPFTLRPATPADYAWLWTLKRDTMRPYVELTWGSWDDGAQERFFRRSFDAQLIQIVVAGGRDAGLLHVEREPGELFLANIQIHPDHQNRGLGTAVVRTVLTSAAALRLPVRLQVLRVNTRAHQLYLRLGFVAAGDTPTHLVLRWLPPVAYPRGGHARLP